ncbi:hypothetical protein CHLNCDRAFT_140852 [Chlorella variabilis]|uniref:SREBP regulating gene protein n=1 Tax=Chlorella variabilis TaxID=554065 RepID=E1Z6C9_CHLVA|nr:hypothetical protein CHLNCDRAFT_140852 [Chlorella variabilis]EFN58627.1 hypothetical protein CHLNCDRAFT_140852 [Chlorella variabilis]|eukprot:XP_005850729.1 hypothetical protein CHLNCDRAFT_140852 [Chlorella variabilis]
MRAAPWGGGCGGGTPLAAVLLSAVQVLAALQLVLPLPAAADGGDFTLRSEPAAGDVEDEYFETVPQGLNSADSSTAPRLGALLEGPKGKQITQCVRKKEIVVFKDGYRSRAYCLSECTQVCALTINPPAKAEAGK